MRYIDADKLLREYQEKICFGVECKLCPFCDTEELTCMLDNWITEQPTADVRENVHSEWVYLGLDVAGEYMYQCLKCEAVIYEPEFLINYDKAQLLGNRFNFCPHCGAEMR